MSKSRAWMYRSVLAASVFLVACGGNKDESVEPKPVRPDAEELVIETVPSVETAGTSVPAVRPEIPPPDAFSPETIMGEGAPLLAVGTEPYWTAEIGDGWITFDRPGLPLVEVPLPEFDTTASQIELISEGLSLSMTKNGCTGDTGSIGVIIAHEEVEFDGNREGVQYLGCAGSSNGAHAMDAGDSSWKDLITPSLSAIDACLAAAEGERLITGLYPREPGTVGMILGDKFGSYEECGADTETGEVYFLDPMSVSQAEDWMTGAAFIREGTNFKCMPGEALAEGEFLPNGCKG
jgi:uncharacterized membrane protein